MIKATALLVLLVVPMVVATDYWWYVSTACEIKNAIVDQSTVNPKHFFKTCNYISSLYYFYLLKGCFQRQIAASTTFPGT